MEDEELDNIIVLNDENGNEVKFEFLDLVELDDEEYVVLLPVSEEGEEDRHPLRQLWAGVGPGELPVRHAPHWQRPD